MNNPRGGSTIAKGDSVGQRSNGGGSRPGDASRLSALTASATSAESVRLAALIDATTALIDEENEAVARNGAGDLDVFMGRKVQALVNLSRTIQGCGRILPDGMVVDSLTRLREALSINCRRLELHISAVAEVSQLIVKAIECAESDGTYGQGAAARFEP